MREVRQKAQGYAVEVNAEDIGVKYGSRQAEAAGERRDIDASAGGCERDLPCQGARTYFFRIKIVITLLPVNVWEDDLNTSSKLYYFM